MHRHALYITTALLSYINSNNNSDAPLDDEILLIRVSDEALIKYDFLSF